MAADAAAGAVGADPQAASAVERAVLAAEASPAVEDPPPAAALPEAFNLRFQAVVTDYSVTAAFI